LAYAILEEAIASGDWINVIDHCPGEPSRQYTMKIVQNIYAEEYAKDYNIETGKIGLSNLAIRMTRKPKPITFLPEKCSVLRESEK